MLIGCDSAAGDDSPLDAEVTATAETGDASARGDELLDAGLGAEAALDAATLEDAATFFSTVRIAETPLVTIAGSGDLWPSCWSDDGHLYAAWGDGVGFAQAPVDIGVARILGSPEDGSLRGENLAVGDAVGQVWTQDGGFTRKPTGMTCVRGDLYLAVQDLGPTFDEAPAATIARSRDKGRTWEWDRTAPMFSGHELTTLFFLDRGQDGARNEDGFVYAYALSGNWRQSYGMLVEDPSSIFMARIPLDALQDRARWQWYGGLDAQGEPVWHADEAQRRPMLSDARRIYRNVTADIGEHVRDLGVIAQGGVVFIAPLGRYLYTSWSEYTFELYEATAPWGPFQHVLSKDFGGYPWTNTKSGGYATTIPSKFISADGRKMYIQSNTFWGGALNYSFSLRELELTPYRDTRAVNLPGEPIAVTPSSGAVAIGSSFRHGRPDILSNGVRVGESEDSRTGEVRELDHWGHEWPHELHLNRVTYVMGALSECVAFADLQVELRRRGRWRVVADATVSPPYDPSTARAFDAYTWTFPGVQVGDGVRVRGKASGASACTSISELAVAYE